MDTKKASKVTWKHIICCMMLLVLFVSTIGIHIDAKGKKSDVVAESSSEVIPLKINNKIVNVWSNAVENEVKLAGPKEEVIEDSNTIDDYITKYENELKFFANTFKIKYDDIIKDLKVRAEQNGNLILDESNVGFLKDANQELKTFPSIEYGMVEYFYNYIDLNPKKVSNKRVPYTGSAEYIENLIIYFTTHIYTNVDSNVALSIGAAESGYYKAKSMLRANNVFGGMSRSGLIKYKNIEYGVLSYIRILSNKYYGKGLITIESIGKKYCPTYDSNGYKIASPHWISLVKTAMNKYNKFDKNITIVDLLK